MAPPDALSHIPCSTPTVIMHSLLLAYFIISLVSNGLGLCGDSIRWSHGVNMDEVYGVWHGVGYAQHTPDMTNLPNKVGCVTLYITDASDEYQDNWFDWSIMRRNYSDEKWKSSRNNPWSTNKLAGSWLDVRLKRSPMKYNMPQDQKRVRVLMDEDGHSLEQIYVYYLEEPGLWTAERLRPMEKELMARGIDMWFPDDPPRHPDVIRLLNVTRNRLILNYCAEVGNSGIFSLILRRSPAKVERWEWYEYQREFSKFDLPMAYRFSAICAACSQIISYQFLLFAFVLILILNNVRI